MQEDQTPNNQPTNQPEKDASDSNPVLSVLRSKIGALYADEPDADQQIKDAEIAGKHRSKHQQYMYDLSTSGMSLSDIQAAWHTYYSQLSDKEKHEVWQEFYAAQDQVPKSSPQSRAVALATSQAQPHGVTEVNHATLAPIAPRSSETRSAATIKNQIINKVRGRSELAQRKSAHLKSLAFGLSMGFFVMIIMLFGFFNERFIAPFMTPSRTVSSTPIIIGPETAVDDEPKIIIPKINVEIPVVFDEPSIREEDVQAALERGVLHYSTTALPGEKGNGAIFGHSSNNILNRGKYKFAFVLLSQLENGDLFYVQKDGVRYTYEVYKKEIVAPTQVSVLDTQERESTMSLITCDPPGTTINRLVVVGEQIDPSPDQNTARKADPTANDEVQELPSDAPTLWQRVRGWFTG